MNSSFMLGGERGLHPHALLLRCKWCMCFVGRCDGRVNGDIPLFFSCPRPCQRVHKQGQSVTTVFCCCWYPVCYPVLDRDCKRFNEHKAALQKAIRKEMLLPPRVVTDLYDRHEEMSKLKLQCLSLVGKEASIERAVEGARTTYTSRLRPRRQRRGVVVPDHDLSEGTTTWYACECTCVTPQVRFACCRCVSRSGWVHGCVDRWP